MIHFDHILWRLRQLLINPRRAIIGRFKLSQKVGDLEIWYEPAEWDPSMACGLTMTEQHPDGACTVWSFDKKGRKRVVKRIPPLGEGG
jgi:hypothetical protein